VITAGHEGLLSIDRSRILRDTCKWNSVDENGYRYLGDEIRDTWGTWVGKYGNVGKGNMGNKGKGNAFNFG